MIVRGLRVKRKSVCLIIQCSLLYVPFTCRQHSVSVFSLTWIYLSHPGAKYKNDCPIEDKIPIYLIVAGAVGVFRNLISLGQRAREGDNDDSEEKRRNPVGSLLDCFLFAWFICGNVWIYRNYEPKYDDLSSPDYCDKTLYLFAFWITTSTYILIGAMCCCVCCVGICAAAFGDGA